MYTEINRSGMTVILTFDNSGEAVFPFDTLDGDTIELKKVAQKKGMTITDEMLAPYSGLVRVRFSFYLEPFDPRYEEHFVQVVDEQSVEFKAGYPGEKKNSIPVDLDAYKLWFKALPRIWQNNPFHNHFDLISSDITDSELKILADKRLGDFGAKWSKSHKSDIVGRACKDMRAAWDKKVIYPKDKTSYTKCALKYLDIDARKDILKKGK